MSANNNSTVIMFQSTVDFEFWLKSHCASSADVCKAIDAFHDLSKVWSEKKAAAFVASRITAGETMDSLSFYAYQYAHKA